MDSFSATTPFAITLGHSTNRREETSTPSSCESPRSATPATSRSSANDIQRAVDIPLSIEAEEFLLNKGHYLPLGCLYFQHPEASDDGQSNDDQQPWQDLVSPPDALSSNPKIHVALSNLLQARRIILSSKHRDFNSHHGLLRIYLLPADVGLRYVGPLDKKHCQALETILENIDISRDSWLGVYDPSSARKFDMFATCDEGSLFYMFNKIPSPSPSIDLIEEKYSREALEDILDPESALPGLRTVLYPYQRRSAGLMLQRESKAQLQLDPRFEPRTAPDGSTFYYGPRALTFLRQPRFYESCRGGLLAETMGLGKTVMLLALILSTKAHQPRIPSPYDLPDERPRVGSLSNMVVSAIHKKSIPYRVEFDRIKYAHGIDMSSCLQRLEDSPPTYSLIQSPVRWNRNTVIPPPKKMIMASTTIVVVPMNLCKQWQSEIQKHVEPEALRVLVMDDNKGDLPNPAELRLYDVVIFTRSRFERENRDGADDTGRRIGSTQLSCSCPYIGATRIRDCHCVRKDELYDSPLKYVHFKRLIIDEGHIFSNPNSIAVSLADKLITADHRWIVSGTPAKDLFGVEVDTTAAQNESKQGRDEILEQRRVFSRKEDTTGAIKNLGSFASHFLRIEPWSSLNSNDERADWDEHVFRHEHVRKRTFSGFSSCFQRTLEAMVVKTQPEDVERDIELPPLSHEIIRLEPSLFDKITANLFNLVLTANAVTSERSDKDYLFHKTNHKARSQLLSINLRQSAFFWTGFSEKDVNETIKVCKKYLKKRPITSTNSDRHLLKEVVRHAREIMSSQGWKSISNSHEIGLFVDKWPDDSAEHWAFDETLSPLLTGVSQLIDAQKYVNKQAGLQDPGEGLSGEGIRATAPARHGNTQDHSDIKKSERPVLAKSGIPALGSEPLLKRRTSANGKGRMPKTPQQVTSDNSSLPASSKQSELNSTPVTEPSPQRAKKRRRSPENRAMIPDLPLNSPFLQSRIIGTTSAKLSYLISQIVKYSEDEKILVFYDGDNIAYYIAQVLELLHIKHEIYARQLSSRLKSEYIVKFDQEAEDRVLLMDVKQAAFGLNLSSASRIYFVNPVCRPNVEAQAIKRAHRIGQTRKVFVETLVLAGTIEEKMLERSKRMTRSEHHDAKQLEDDGGIRAIIQNARPLKIEEEEKSGGGQMAPLNHPEQLWGRPGWRDALGVLAPVTSSSNTGEQTNHHSYDKNEDANERPVKRMKILFEDITRPDTQDRIIIEEDHETPVSTYNTTHSEVVSRLW